MGAITRSLGNYPIQGLEKRFYSQAEQFRQEAAPYFSGDQEILAYQRGFFELLRRFYGEAAHGKEFMLHLIV